ncbi:CTP-transf-like domain-containing protein [Aphelenchoides fujianensis]|nr:CTP-transf-like domain-containing protein [Aphelenchoides fujianensis]
MESPSLKETPAEMTETATLLVRSPSFRDRIADLLIRSAPKVRSRLYVQLHPPPTPAELLSALPTVYEAATRHCPQLDVRLLLGVSKPKLTTIFDEGLNEKDLADPPAGRLDGKKFDFVVLGGTFDRIHYGHKLLLSTAILLANEYIVCGVTDKEMNHKKKLWELIQPVEKRIADVHEFVADVSEGVELRAEPIVDPFGPSIVDRQLQCIVVSKETAKGGEAVNKKRQERGLSTLEIVEIPLLEGADTLLQETKLSSSAIRRSLLGRHLRPPRTPDFDYAKEKYVIGLTGGICSGKTNISKVLAEQGCEIIDCDKIGHEVLATSAEVRERIADAFGAHLIKDDVVDRRALGAHVFRNKERLEQLSHLMWPIMADVLLERIRASDKKIVVVDAAVLLEAGWERFVHEVWTAMVPVEEALRRVIERDRLTEELARDRVNSQESAFWRIQRSHVVICSLSPMPTRTDGERPQEAEEEFEEVLVVAELNGVIDPGVVTRALAEKDVTIRFAESEAPVVQVGSSIFAGSWKQTAGTDMIFAPASSDSAKHAHELVGISSTRLTANKMIVSEEQPAAAPPPAK